MSPVVLRHSFVLLAVIVLFNASCEREGGAEAEGAGSDALPELSPEELGAISADRVRLSLPWGTGIMRNRGVESDSVGTLLNVSVSAEQGFDRITVEFEGPASAVGWELQPATGPLEACDGEPVVSGPDPESWVNVQFVRLHAAPQAVEQLEASSGMPVIQEIRVACAEQDRVTLAIRRSGPGRHRVTEATRPNAVVIDLES